MRILNVEWKWNIPNALSLLRLALIPCFSVLYICRQDLWAFAALLLSGVTDMLDGFLARRLGQVTDCGKLLDPLADKLTQVMVVICLTTRYREVLPLTVVCFVKELCQGVGGLILLREHCAVRGAKWFGKVSTVTFYGCMLAVVLWKDAPDAVVIVLVGLAAAAMLGAFFGYLGLFFRIRREEREDRAEPKEDPLPGGEPQP